MVSLRSIYMKLQVLKVETIAASELDARGYGHDLSAKVGHHVIATRAAMLSQAWRLGATHGAETCCLSAEGHGAKPRVLKKIQTTGGLNVIFFKK